jgi:ribosomal protein S18 acetylase RimI-like enzyme
MAVTVRAAQSRADLDAIGRVELSFTTDRIYRVHRAGLAFRLEEDRVDPPVTKTYPRPALDLSDDLLVACADGEIVGYGEVRFEPWNDRAAIEHIYVSPVRRGQGVGRSLIDALAEQAARRPSARCLWLETQNVNFPAVQFYMRMGFRLCGLDQTLYRPEPHILPDETALYFTRDL